MKFMLFTDWMDYNMNLICFYQKIDVIYSCIDRVQLGQNL